MKISFDNMCKFHKQVTEYYTSGGEGADFDEVLLRPLQEGFEVVKIRNGRIANRTWWKQNENNLDLVQWVE